MSDKGAKVFAIPVSTTEITKSDSTSVNCKALRVVGTGENLSYRHNSADTTHVVTLADNETFPCWMADGRVMAATTIGTLVAFDY